MQMLTIQSHSPAAAPDLEDMNSRLNSGLGLSAGPVYLRTSALFSSRKPSLGTPSLGVEAITYDQKFGQGALAARPLQPPRDKSG